MGFGDFELAAQMRDTIVKMVASEVKRLRPETRVARVITVNRENLTAEVSFAGDEGSLNARFGKSLIPRGEGDLVRVAGKVGDYYITEILNGTGIHEDYEPIKEAVDSGEIPTATTVQASIDAVVADVNADIADVYTAINSGDTANQNYINTQINNVNGTVSNAISSYVNEYAVNSSETVAPSSGWSTTQPVRTPGTFIWFRTVVTRVGGATATTTPALLTGNTGAAGDQGPAAPQIILTATAQALVTPFTGGVSVPATSVVTGTATNTTITTVEFSVDGGAWTGTNPTGATGTGNTRTITGQTMTASTIAVRMKDANGVSDTLTVAKVLNGATGADAYTIFLTNEAQVFAGSQNAAVAASPAATTSVIAYKGISTITGTITAASTLPTGLTVSGLGTSTVTFNTTTALTQQSGTVDLTISADSKTFTKTFSWSVAYTGAPGISAPTITSVTTYYQQTADSVNSVTTPTASPPPAPWTTTPPAYAAATRLWRTDRVLYSDATFTYTTPVRDQSYEASLVAITSANGKNKITHAQAAPGSAANSTGDTWFQYSDAGLTNLVSVWRGGGGTTWIDTAFDVTMIPQIDIGTGTFGSLNGGRLQAQTVQTDRLLVASFDNYLNDPEFRVSLAGTDRTWENPAWASIVTNGSRNSNLNVLRITNTGVENFVYNLPVDSNIIEPGQWLRSSCYIKSSAAVGTGLIYMTVRFKLTTGAYTYDTSCRYRNPSTMAELSVPANTWVLMQGRVQAPANAVSYSVYVATAASLSTGTVDFELPSVTRAASSELIVDGSIRSIHITADMVNGLILTGGIIQTSQSNVGVKISSSGFVWYNSSGQSTFSMDNSGNITMNGNLATSATITGATVRTSSSNPRVEINSSGIYAYNSSGTQTFSIVGTGGDGTFSGTVASAATISGTLSGDKIVGGSITGSTLTTAGAGSTRTEIGTTATGGSNYIGFYVGSTKVGNIYGTTGLLRMSAGSGLGSIDALDTQVRMLVNGSGVTVTDGAVNLLGGVSGFTMSGNLAMGSNNLNNVGTLNSTTISNSGNTTTSKLFVTGPGSGSASPNVRYVNNASGGELIYTSGSSIRIKKDVVERHFTEEQMFGVRVVDYRLKEDAVDRPKGFVHVGVIAEEINELGLGQMVDYDEEGLPCEVDYARLALIALDAVKFLRDKVDALEARLS